MGTGVLSSNLREIGHLNSINRPFKSLFCDNIRPSGEAPIKLCSECGTHDKSLISTPFSIEYIFFAIG